MTEVVAIIALCISAASFSLLLWNKVMEVRGSWRGASISLGVWGDGTVRGNDVTLVEMKNLTVLPFYVTSYMMVDCSITNLEGHPPPSVLAGGETVHLAVDARSPRPWVLISGYSMRNFRIGEAGWWGLAQNAFTDDIDRQLSVPPPSRLRLIWRWGRRRGRPIKPVTVGPNSYLGTAYHRFRADEETQKKLWEEAVEAGGTFLLR